MQPGTDREDRVIPLAAETARAERTLRETGRVRVTVRTETLPETVEETLRTSRVSVERVPVGRTLADGEAIPQPREAPDGTWIIPVLEEALVIERRLVLREEVHVRREDASETLREVVELRRQRAEVERRPPETPNPDEPERNAIP